MIGMLDSARRLAAEREAVLARQHQVEEDEIDAAVGQDLAHGTAVRRGADPEALLGQRTRDEIADLAVVVDDQDMRCARHEREYRRAGRRTVLRMCVEVLPARRLTHFVTKNLLSEKLGEIFPLQWLSNGPLRWQ